MFGPDFSISPGLFRGSNLDVFDGPGLPSTPDPRLLDLELSQFGYSIGDAFAKCGGRLRVIANIEQPAVIHRILAYLGREAGAVDPAHPSRAPPRPDRLT